MDKRTRPGGGAWPHSLERRDEKMRKKIRELLE
jgi:hypothetical protein